MIGYRKQLFLGPLFKLIEAIFELAVPLVVASMIDKGVKTGDTGYIWRMGGLLLVLGIVGLCSTLVCQYYASAASQGVGTVLRRELFAHIQTFSHVEFDRFGAHSLVTRVTSDVNQLQLAVAMLIRLCVRVPFLAVGAVIMAFTVDVRSALIILAAIPMIALVLYWIMRKTAPLFGIIQKKLDRISQVIRENTDGVRVIRAFAREEDEVERFGEANEDLAGTVIGAGRISALLNPLTYMIMYTATALLLYLGGRRIAADALTQGQLVALVNYMNQILLALIVAANLVVIFTKASASAVRVNEIFDTVPTVFSPEVSAAADTGDNAVVFDHVSFGYGGDNVIDSFCWQVKRGSTVGIIGGTGSGKSTLASLIMRFYDVTEGAVRVNGADVRDQRLDDLRRTAALVLQKAELFSGTLEENIRFGRSGVTDQDITEALDIAQAKDFAGQKGWDFHIEEGGKNLSGGQRQRLNIARALAGRPDILILDDSASALDTVTDSALRKAIRERLQGMTLIIISQRIAAVREADSILVLDNGAVAGEGTHDELMASCSVYREIAHSQSEGGILS